MPDQQTVTAIEHLTAAVLAHAVTVEMGNKENMTRERAIQNVQRRYGRFVSKVVR